VLREIEQASVSAFHLTYPLVRPGLLNAGRQRARHRKACGSDRPKHVTEKRATMGRGF